MATDEMNPLRLDVAALAARGLSLSGHWPLETLQRLATAAHAERPTSVQGAVGWAARGELLARSSGAKDQTWLHLEASVTVALQCQRCLEPVEVELKVDQALRFVEGEDQAAALDAESEQDVLALPRWLDLRELVEDELLLALPLVPRHERCPTALLAPGGASEFPGDAERPNPFAVLRKLKAPGAPEH